jgi:hypothetical protein
MIYQNSLNYSKNKFFPNEDKLGFLFLHKLFIFYRTPFILYLYPFFYELILITILFLLNNNSII